MSKISSTKHKWVLLDWDGENLRPHANYDMEQISGRLPKGATVRVQFAQPRSLPRHRLYWVVVRQVVKNSEFFATEEALHSTLLLGCGVVTPVLSINGDVIMIPNSTAFDAMEEDEFKKYFDRAMEIIGTKIMPGVDVSDLLAEAKRESKWKEAA